MRLSWRFWLATTTLAIFAMVFSPLALGQPAPVNTISFDGQHVTTIAISPNGETLAMAMLDRLELLKVSSGTAARTINTGEHFLLCLTFTADGEGIVGVDGNKRARLWPLTAQLEERSFPVPNLSPQVAASSPSSPLLAIDGRETTVQIVDYTSGKRKLVLDGHTGGIFAVAFSPDGQSLVSSGGDGKVIIWPLKNKDLPHQVAVHGPVGDWVLDVTYSPDGKTIASCSGDRVKLWSSATGEHVATIGKLPRTVSNVRYSPDGSMLFAASGDGVIVVCNVTTGAMEGIAKAHDMRIYGLELSADGKWLVSWDLDEVKIWKAAELSQK